MIKLASGTGIYGPATRKPISLEDKLKKFLALRFRVKALARMDFFLSIGHGSAAMA